MVRVEDAAWLRHVSVNGAVAAALPLGPYVPGHKNLFPVLALRLGGVSDVSAEGASAGCYFGSGLWHCTLAAKTTWLCTSVVIWQLVCQHRGGREGHSQ